MIRAAIFGVALLLAGCAVAPDDSPQRPAAPAAPLSYDYLTKLGLGVSEIVIDDTWTPLADSGEHVEDEASPRPVEALSRMIRDRLVAAGGAGRALVTVEDASLVRVPGQLIGTFSVQIALQGAPGQPAPVTAAVSGTRTLASDSSERETADTLLRQLMDRLNVELEYQVRRQLANYSGGSASPVPSAVQTESLPPPEGGTAAPPTVVPQPALPESPAPQAVTPGPAVPDPAASPPEIDVPAAEPPPETHPQDQDAPT